jgi:predicted HD phosphohydrolase
MRSVKPCRSSASRVDATGDLCVSHFDPWSDDLPRTDGLKRSGLEVNDVIDQLLSIYEGRAHRQYGLSSLSQRAHALQAACLARTQRLPQNLVVACLLHDIGHMVHGLGEHPAAECIDDRHEQIGADWLASYFGPQVTEPVRLHVEAKRYLCAVESGYLLKLSQDSIQSLVLQGGAMSDTEVAAFRATRGWEDAVVVRRIDDLAKDPDRHPPDFADFVKEVNATLRRS